jgi:motility quorum-sensing regulator/GCU-specific mRNA interferase toxin
MEKRTPHCDLSTVRRLIAERKVRVTQAATRTAVQLGFTPRDFYKSMTTYGDNTVWQDVYRPTTEVGDIYLKLTVVHDVLIVSFKEL